MILVAALTAVFFFGGWLSPLDGYLSAGSALRHVPVLGLLLGDGTHWLVVQDVHRALRVFCGCGHVSALSLRSDHASGLESTDP